MVTSLVVEGRDDVGGAWWLPTPSTPASSPLQPSPPPPSDASVTDPGTNFDIHSKIYTKRVFHETNLSETPWESMGEQLYVLLVENEARFRVRCGNG
ncbi:unnamed protein product [Lactuca saligna]|uniref:Uncharacterized protein n=1 Tax=Lactuca saligna TaxID=75948 RepID=A0AA35YJU4_LACSI|nr:unnamed protein product [Lactuca saligna]